MRTAMTTGKKVASGFGLSLLVLISIGVAAYWNSVVVADTSSRVAHTYELLAGLEILMSQLQDAETGQRGYLLTSDKAYLEPYNSALQRIPKEIDKLSLLTKDHPEQQRKIDESLDSIIAEKLEELKGTIDLHEKGEPEKALALVKTDRGKKAMDQIRKLVASLKQDEHRLMDEREMAAKVSTRTTYLGIGISSVLAIVSVVGTAILIIRSIRTSTRVLLTATQEMIVSSNEIAAGSQQQVASLSQTATSLNEITSTAEEFKATMQEFADRARAVQEAASETTKQTVEGRSLAQESASRIEQVRTNSQAAGASVLKLAEQMQRIGEITTTVNEIAEQTKMLALNASIEAARAGEEGRGFAVVATQVRELANQSKEAVGRIESLIGTTRRSMQDVVSKIEDGGRLADESTEIVQKMTVAFDDIAGAIEQTTDAMAQINTGAHQQELGITELVSSITEIDSASKESLTAAEQTQRAIFAINGQIKRLNDTMETF